MAYQHSRNIQTSSDFVHAPHTVIQFQTSLAIFFLTCNSCLNHVHMICTNVIDREFFFLKTFFSANIIKMVKKSGTNIEQLGILNNLYSS